MTFDLSQLMGQGQTQKWTKWNMRSITVHNLGAHWGLYLWSPVIWSHKKKYLDFKGSQTKEIGNNCLIIHRFTKSSFQVCNFGLQCQRDASISNLIFHLLYIYNIYYLQHRPRLLLHYICTHWGLFLENTTFLMRLMTAKLSPIIN